MNEDRGDRFDRAAEELTEAAHDSYRAAVGRAFEARESHERLTRHFFEDGIGLLGDHAETNRRTMRQLTEQARERREAFRELSRSSVDSYSGFLDSLSSYSESVSEKHEGRG
jgi:pyrroloquinoline quinone (PQQ) biosynthesis protein C